MSPYRHLHCALDGVCPVSLRARHSSACLCGQCKAVSRASRCVWSWCLTVETVHALGQCCRSKGEALIRDPDRPRVVASQPSPHAATQLEGMQFSWERMLLG